ncbi:hypothetical protein M407DRAFT_247209, partial [Tulasnella calospora MUT 4182]
SIDNSSRRLVPPTRTAPSEALRLPDETSKRPSCERKANDRESRDTFTNFTFKHLFGSGQS